MKTCEFYVREVHKWIPNEVSRTRSKDAPRTQVMEGCEHRSTPKLLEEQGKELECHGDFGKCPIKEEVRKSPDDRLERRPY